MADEIREKQDSPIKNRHNGEFPTLELALYFPGQGFDAAGDLVLGNKNSLDLTAPAGRQRDWRFGNGGRFARRHN